MPNSVLAKNEKIFKQECKQSFEDLAGHRDVREKKLLRDHLFNPVTYNFYLLVAARLEMRNDKDVKDFFKF